MHIVIVAAIGLVALGAFVLAGTLLNRIGGWRIDGAFVFIWVWLGASLANAYDGWANYGIPLVNEIAALIPIFGIPAAAAWYWSRRSRATLSI
jgi:hypothetical protein